MMKSIDFVTSKFITDFIITIKGTQSNLENIKASDIEAYVDLKGYEEGTHDVKVKVVGNDNKVIYEPDISTVKVIIIKK